MGPLTIVGGFVVAIGVALICAEYWSGWTSPVRIFATLGISLVLLALSVVPSIAKMKGETLAGALAAIGSPLLPIGVFVTLEELGFKSGHAGTYWVLFLSGLALSLLSLWQKRGTYAFFGFPIMVAGAVILARFYVFGDYDTGWFMKSNQMPGWYGDVESLVAGLVLLSGAWWAAQNAKRLLVELWALVGLATILSVPFLRWFDTSSYLWLILSALATALAFMVAGKMRSWLGLVASAIATIMLAVEIGGKYFSDNAGVAVVVVGLLIILFGSGTVFTWRRWFKRES